MNEFLNIKAKKSLGQNFLKSKKALSAMVEAGEVGEKDIVLEAGPGKGALTEELLKKADKVIAVEKDDVLMEFLRQKFSADIASGKLELIHGDILDFNPTTHNLKPKTYKLLANIPYYITGQFLRKFLSGENQPSKMVILLQKEVVKRIVANDGKESILSISVKAYGKPKNIGKVSKENFSPKPKIDSAILLIDDISRVFFKDDGEEKKFFELVKAGFAHKRKLLARNMGHLAKNREDLEKIFETCAIPPKARAEDIKLEQWKRITKETLCQL
ncbi:MAG: ribosomal RNA small subunit methyltransferase A [Patescibacteria group bacterium]|nr:ribosomal RNA small subunit methyltransferase A [Patescibacteria group bacterium]MDE1988132.1 ribosomal RNA small subunit methyltransferase A [Patescibacteria group bacterium]MDE2218009.1 ribosomal RNA small subunit methyltransferase A [Patescibacteria group bacterium]